MFIDAWSRRVPQEFAPDGEVLRSIWKPALDSAVLIMESENSGAAAAGGGRQAGGVRDRSSGSLMPHRWPHC